jgi:ABC-2 type transport system ATP-binding protein
MIETENLSKSFREIEAVRDVSFRIPANSITTIAGADGSGKSTIFKMLMGLMKRDSGTISLKNRDIGEDFSRITRLAGYMPERFSLYPDLSVDENLNFYADINQVTRSRREELKQRLLKTTGMIQFKKRRARDLSGGMKQKLALSSILLSAPELVLLDEPTTGVDPLSRIEFFNIIKDLKQEGKTIFISTPYLDEAENSDHIIFLKEGRIIKKGAMKTIREHFPARIFSILPRGNMIEVMERLQRHPDLKNSVYIRGKFLKYMQVSPESHLELIPAASVKEESPRLEDIFLFYERQSEINPEGHHAATH